MDPSTPKPTSTSIGSTAPGPPQLERRFGLLQASALNMSNMVGIGPFLTIPILMSSLGGPQSLLGWLVALIITAADALIWSELGAALPGSGGSYRFLREGFGRETWGRLMAFLFIWQFIVSGPLEIASGYIGFARYASYLWPGISPLQVMLFAAALGVANVALLYRRIHSIARLTVFLWIGTLLTTGVVVLTGMAHFNPARAFSMPPNPFQFSMGFLFGLAAASRIGVYDYLGYYDICYIGDEVKEPGRVIPRSVILSLFTVAALYVLINLSITGVIPWQEFVPAGDKPEISNYVVSVFMERIYGAGFARFFTLMILWTTVGSVFALLLGYSRVPFAAARDGLFFKPFGQLHEKGFPSLSLLVIGGVAVACSFVDLTLVIDALLTTRIWIQFIGQAVALILLRRRAPEMDRPYRMWLYPIPCVVAILGWIFIFATAGEKPILLGLGSLVLGVCSYLAWASRSRTWPFLRAQAG